MAENYEDLVEFYVSVARYAALPPDQRPNPDYHWWTPAESLEGVSYLRKKLHQNPGSTHRVYLGLTDGPDPRVTLWSMVADEHGTILGGYNNSFGCPPHC